MRNLPYGFDIYLVNQSLNSLTNTNIGQCVCVCNTHPYPTAHSRESGQITTLVFCPFCHGSLSPPNSICHVVLRSHRQTGVHRAVHWCAPCAVCTSDEGKIEKLAVITIISRDGGRYTYFLMDIEDKLGTKTFRIAYRQYTMTEGVKSRDVTAWATRVTEVTPIP